MREVVLDTETTGLDPADGHRVVEIGCVELLNHVPSGRVYQAYVNPERPVPAEAFAVHGLSDAFLADKPAFAQQVQPFLDFLSDSPLVIHNAAFDIGFLNAELARLGRPPLPLDRAVDTVRLARSKFAGAPANLDALCRRFGIDNTERTLHGALKDAWLLAQVYLQLLGGRQPALVLSAARPTTQILSPRERTPRVLAPTAAEREAHETLLDRLNKPIWRQLDG